MHNQKFRDILPEGSEFIIFLTATRPNLLSSQAQWESGALSLGVQRTGSKQNHLHPPSAEDKNFWIYTSILRTSSRCGAYSFTGKN
jgi:hypothetical protein